jgi:hypothetical protein
MGAKHRSKFAALSPVMVTAAGKLKNCSGGYKKKPITSIFDGELLNIDYILQTHKALLLHWLPICRTGTRIQCSAPSVYKPANGTGRRGSDTFKYKSINDGNESTFHLNKWREKQRYEKTLDDLTTCITCLLLDSVDIILFID